MGWDLVVTVHNKKLKQQIYVSIEHGILFYNILYLKKKEFCDMLNHETTNNYVLEFVDMAE